MSQSRTAEEKRGIHRRFNVEPGHSLVSLTLRSGNRKTGPIPVSITERGSCPAACGLREGGCYAELGRLGWHWRLVPDRGMPWSEFCARIAELPAGQLWRHNEAGDLPGRGDVIDVSAMSRLVRANAAAGARGFTYTHKPVLARGDWIHMFHVLTDNREAIRGANAAGFAVNLSSESVSQADQLADLRIAPVVVVVPADYPDRGGRTPAGRRVVVCPAQTREAITCASCRLCAHPARKSIVGFRAHGATRIVEESLVQLRLPGVSRRKRIA
jgi:hypothetical protein